MNYRITAYIIGKILMVEGLFMMLPMMCAVFYKEYRDIIAFIIPALCLLAAGLLLSVKKPKNMRMGAKEGFISVGLAWILVSLVGAVPLVIGGMIPNYVDAFFEIVSGFTTTGSSVIRTLSFDEHHGLYFWRSFTNWIGGMGILVFMLAVLPKTDTISSKYMYALKAESPGPQVGKIVPKLRDTARILYLIYIALSAAEFLLLILGKVSVYSALLHTFSTAGTGGFGLYGDSIGSFSPYCQYVISIFMILFATNFNIYFLVITGNIIAALKSEELRWFWIIIICSVTTITISVFCYNGIGGFSGGEKAFREALFQVASLMSTTGFSTVDFNNWPVLCKTILLILMFIGGCAGSTGGGIKVSRIMMLIKNGLREIRYVLNPNAVIPVKIEGKKVDHKVIRGTTSYLIIYIIIFVFSWILISGFENGKTVNGNVFDIETNFSAVAACLNNIGPGMGKIIGPTGNFADYSAFSKIILAFDMLVGRLEIFPILIIFSPSTWLTSLKYSVNKIWLGIMRCRRSKDEISDADEGLN